MTSQSKIGAVFLTLFGLPFLGAGLLFAWKFLQAPNQTIAQRLGAASFGSVFAVIGAGLIFAGIYGYSQQKRQSEIQVLNPASPWLWRKDWAASRVESRNKSTAIGWWIAAVLVNMMSLPFSLSAAAHISQNFDPAYLVPAAFEIIGLLLLFAAIRATFRLERFGHAYFELNALPFSPGGHVAGSIHFQLQTETPHGVDLKLSCIRRIVTGSGNNRSTQSVPLWEDSKNIPAPSLSRGPLDTIIPVDFAIPADAYQTDHEHPSDQVLWLLDVKADVPGVDYTDHFELPVFRTSQSPSAFPVAATNALASGPFSRFTTTTPGEIDQDVSEPAQHRVVVVDQPDGLEFYFRPGRNIARAILILVLAAGCTALFYALFHIARRPPVFAFIVVGLMDFILIMASVHSALSSTRIVVGNGLISWRRSVLGIGPVQQFQSSSVESITVVTGLQQAGSSGSAFYSIRLKPKDGKARTLVDDIESRQEARWIVSQIEKRAGFALNTQVEISNSFYGPPPQPQNGYDSRTGGFAVTTKTGGTWSQAVGLLFFIGWVAFIGLMMFRTTRIRSSRSRAISAATAPAPRFVRTPQMRQSALEELSKWPAQQQGEKLLARSVQHDSVALQALTQSSAHWVGTIHRTDNLEQVENAARYSSDLRVRRAEADLELIADGWTKTPQTVELLLNRAQSDPSYRGAALYFLGVLAGDGIDSERAHSLLVDYARKDPDASVRQWATEGLRFVGTDQALDELFDIFTHDASPSVRDRAGCNISDCGIFQRKQRLRMVPRLIDLVSDPHSSAQMRDWSFLALRGITDENLPADAAAWRQWYAANARAKQAQFAALEWYQVRGDN
ncbi:MAG TPA: HEAT repeat domain-containing protein [Candidatus Acidoferrales bacterium]|nr:HEAT repeat domain-containing protein [Candidatus Acidoferrales bacterium]